MIYALIMFACIAIYPIVANGIRPCERLSKKRRIYYCFVIAFLFFLVAALRGVDVGVDVGTYSYVLYPNISKLAWKDVLSYPTDHGFAVLVKILSFFSRDPQILLAVVGFFFAFSVAYCIYNLSVDYACSFLLLIPLLYFATSLSALRQTVALSFVLLGYVYTSRRQLARFMISVVLGTSFHVSAFFALPVYLLYSIKPTQKIRLLCLACFLFVYPFRRIILNFFLSFFYSDYSAYAVEAGTQITLILYICIWILYIILVDNLKPYSFELPFVVGILIQSFVPLNPNIFRLALYYQMTSLFLVPQILHSKKMDNGARIVAWIGFAIIMFVMYFFFTAGAADTLPYLFFWEN